MDFTEDYDDLVIALYARLTATGDWAEPVERLRRALGAHSVHMSVTDGAGKGFTIERCGSRGGGNPLRGNRPVPAEEDAARVLAWSEGVGAGVRASVRVVRGDDLPVFAPPERTLFRRLVPHFRRALQLATRCLPAQQPPRQSMETLAPAHFGVLLIDEGSTVLDGNAAALRILAAGDGLMMDDRGCLACLRRTEAHELQAGIARLVADGGSGSTGAQELLGVPRPSGRRPYGLRIARIAGQHHLTLRRRAVLRVTIADPEAPVVLSAEHLRSLHGLTPAEARVAVLLADGASAEEIAQSLGIAVATVRVHTASIYRKCGVSSCPALARLVVASTPSLGAALPAVTVRNRRQGSNPPDDRREGG